MHSKLYGVIIVIIGLIATPEVHDLTYYTSIVIAAGVCFGVTYFRDADNPNRPNWKYRLACSVAASYLAYFLYPSVKEFELNLVAYKFHPFNTIQIFVGACSLFSIKIFKEANALSNFGWRDWLSRMGDKFKALAEKK